VTAYLGSPGREALLQVFAMVGPELQFCCTASLALLVEVAVASVLASSSFKGLLLTGP